ncbi:MAG: peptide-methionine (R)-S-oxide reductase MsrB [Clostridia bacterium]
MQSLAQLQNPHQAPIAVEVGPLRNFWPAEEYHQKYLDRNPLGYCHIGKEKLKAAQKAGREYRRKSQEELAKSLTQMQYEVTQNKGTEPPLGILTGINSRKGSMWISPQGSHFFSPRIKFDSGCGWPSFSKPIEPWLLEEFRDSSHGMERIEVRSRTGNSHLGHVFTDGPRKGVGCGTA